MDARTIYNLLKPHLEIMEARERECLSQLITETPSENAQRRRKILTLSGVKEKLKNFRMQEIARERKEVLKN